MRAGCMASCPSCQPLTPPQRCRASFSPLRRVDVAAGRGTMEAIRAAALPTILDALFSLGPERDSPRARLGAGLGLQVKVGGE